MAVQCKMAAAAVVGASHQERGQPCQDYTAKTRHHAISAVALADGAGSAMHSALGARIVVTAILKLLRTEFHTLLNQAGDPCAERIIHCLQRSLDSYAQRREIGRGQLASTLLFVATDGRDYLCGQVGDGRIARCNAEGSAITSVFEPAKGEYFNQTVFVTSRDALEEFDLEWGEMDDIGGFALMSDGAEESLYQRGTGTFAAALPKMLGWLDRYSEAVVRGALSRNLRDTLSLCTGDDLSVALMRFTPSSTTPPAPLTDSSHSALTFPA
ncbi:MAG: protein phosphatase 2C domain-containing protein [Candidatus Contendobacter sp.]|nr:protein phosphatase 2C domain-containing protein [Candidatus Contendobacter sp.]